MSMFFRQPDRDGWNRFEGIPDVFGPYPEGDVRKEEYSKKPVSSNKQVAAGHHLDCTYDHMNIDTCMCFELYTRDYDEEQDQEAEEMHQEWWQ